MRFQKKVHRWVVPRRVASLGEEGLSSRALQTLSRPAANSGKASSPDEKGVSRRALQIWNLPDAPHGEKGFHGRTLRILDRPVAVPPKRPASPWPSAQDLARIGTATPPRDAVAVRHCLATAHIPSSYIFCCYMNLL